jgi:hypothetical protein
MGQSVASCRIDTTHRLSTAAASIRRIKGELNIFFYLRHSSQASWPNAECRVTSKRQGPGNPYLLSILNLGPLVSHMTMVMTHGKDAMRHIFVFLFPRECRVRLCAVLVSFGYQYTATERLSPQGRRHSCDKYTVVIGIRNANTIRNVGWGRTGL